jgi:hypothetical protein
MKEDTSVIIALFATTEARYFPTKLYNFWQNMEAGQTSDIAETPPANPAPSEFRRVAVSETSFTTLYDGSEKDGKDAIVE